MMSDTTVVNMTPTLEEHLIEANTPDDFDGGRGWQIRSSEEADWAGRKLQQIYAECDEAKQQWARVVDQATDWLVGITDPLDRDIEFFEGHLSAWLEREIEADDSKKPRQSRSLPCGVTVKRTKGRERVDVFDEDAFVAWALDTDHTDLIKTKHAPSKVDIAGLTQHDGQFITEDGEIVPGVTVVTGEDRYTVDVGGTSDG